MRQLRGDGVAVLGGDTRVLSTGDTPTNVGAAAAEFGNLITASSVNINNMVECLPVTSRARQGWWATTLDSTLAHPCASPAHHAWFAHNQHTQSLGCASPHYRGLVVTVAHLSRSGAL